MVSELANHELIARLNHDNFLLDLVAKQGRTFFATVNARNCGRFATERIYSRK